MTKKRKVEIELSKHCVGGFRMTKRYSYFNANMVGQLKRENKKLKEENEQLKQYKQSVNDVLKSWSQKNLTAKQLQVVLAIMEELNVMGDME